MRLLYSPGISGDKEDPYWGAMPGIRSVGREAEAVCRHCLLIFATETIKI